MNQMAKHELGHTRTQGYAATRVLSWSVLGLALLVSACSTQRVSRPAPVEDRGTSRSTSDAAPSASAPAAAQPRVGYVTVQPGDTLSKISQQYYGNRTRVKDLYAANRNVMKSETDLKPGMILRIP